MATGEWVANQRDERLNRSMSGLLEGWEAK
jgi:hypothetical protein